MKSRIVFAFSAIALIAAAANARLAAPDVADAVILEDGLPRTLSDFGFFIDAAAQIPTIGVKSYQLNTPLYSDGAEKLRFYYVPNGQTITPEGDNLLQLPVGSALIKTFAFDDGDRRKLIETRVLLHRADGWLALPYVWNAQQTEARLAIAGKRLPVTTPSGEQISYRVPNKNQCKECHGLNGEVVPIGPKARNLSRDAIGEMVAAGLLDGIPQGTAEVPLWSNREQVSAESAARGYLDVNCAHCHRPGATASNSGLDLRWEQGTASAIGILKRPVAAGRGSGGLEFDIVPGKPDQSILHYRMASPETGVAMPELGKATVDKDGVAAIERWIAEMK